MEHQNYVIVCDSSKGVAVEGTRERFATLGELVRYYSKAKRKSLGVQLRAAPEVHSVFPGHSGEDAALPAALAAEFDDEASGPGSPSSHGDTGAFMVFGGTALPDAERWERNKQLEQELASSGRAVPWDVESSVLGSVFATNQFSHRAAESRLKQQKRIKMLAREKVHAELRRSEELQRAAAGPAVSRAGWDGPFSEDSDGLERIDYRPLLASTAPHEAKVDAQMMQVELLRKERDLLRLRKERAAETAQRMRMRVGLGSDLPPMDRKIRRPHVTSGAELGSGEDSEVAMAVEAQPRRPPTPPLSATSSERKRKGSSGGADHGLPSQLRASIENVIESMDTATLGGGGGMSGDRTRASTEKKRSRTVTWDDTGEAVGAEGKTVRIAIQDHEESLVTPGEDSDGMPSMPSEAAVEHRPFANRRGIRTGMSVYERPRRDQDSTNRSMIFAGDRGVPTGLRKDEISLLRAQEVQERQRRESFDYKMTSALKTLRRHSVEKQPEIRRRLQEAKAAERKRRETWNRAWDKRELKLLINRPDASDDLFRLLEEEAEREAAAERARDRNTSEAVAASKHGRVSVADRAMLFQQVAANGSRPVRTHDTGDHDTVFGFGDEAD